MILCSKLKHGLSKIVTKSQVVTEFNVNQDFTVICTKQFMYYYCIEYYIS